MSIAFWTSGSDATIDWSKPAGSKSGCVALPPFVHTADAASGSNTKPPLPALWLARADAGADARGPTALSSEEHPATTPSTPTAANCQYVLVIGPPIP